MAETGTSAKRLKQILLGLLADSLGELRKYSRELDIQRVDREGGRIYMTDGRVFTLELRAEASMRGRFDPRRR